MRARDFLIPHLPRREWRTMAFVTLAGAILGGSYGVLHDQVTFRIAPEYFTKNKFDQFSYARPDGGSDLHFASRIGFLATWWVGALTAWAIARVSVSRFGGVAHWRILRNAFGIVFATSALFALAGWGYGQWRISTGYATGWIEWMDLLGVTDRTSFMTVGYIHNASYLGGVLGMVGGILYLGKKGKPPRQGSP